MTGMRRIVMLGALALVALPFGATDASALRRISVKHNHLVAGHHHKHKVRLLGVNRSGTEYMCMPGGGYNIFDGPSDVASIRAMKTWHINAVRVPLAEDCWLNINGAEVAGDQYRNAIVAWVKRLQRQGLYVILDLHVAGPGSEPSTTIIRMPDADHAPTFWHSVARRFKNNHRVLFDLYNEPHDIGWSCWRNGCVVPDSTDDGVFTPSYQATGMRQLVKAVRSTGARQPLMLGGIQWSSDVTQWKAHRPPDPRHQLVVSQHQYGGLSPCETDCKTALNGLRHRYPVVVGEFGQTDCNHDYIDAFMPWFDHRGISYLGWTWDSTDSGWSCSGGPSLIKDYAGTPTNFGVGLRTHLRQIR